MLGGGRGDRTTQSNRTAVSAQTAITRKHRQSIRPTLSAGCLQQAVSTATEKLYHAHCGHLLQPVCRSQEDMKIIEETIVAEVVPTDVLIGTTAVPGKFVTKWMVPFNTSVRHLFLLKCTTNALPGLDISLRCFTWCHIMTPLVSVHGSWSLRLLCCSILVCLHVSV